MKIPNCERAVVDIRKLRDYCLSLEHLRGRHKAHVFASVLGLTAKDAEELQVILLEVVCNDTATNGEQDDYGQRYLIDFILTWNDNTADVRGTWIIRSDENFPRLTSCYVI